MSKPTVEIPQYTWGITEAGGYHINGVFAASAKQAPASVLATRVFPGLNQLPKGSLVADFGCGDGRLIKKAPHYSSRPYILRGYELNPEAVASFNRYQRELGYSPDRAEQADLTRLDIGQERFQAALFWRVLHSIPNQLHRPVLEQIVGTLKRGASLHVAVLSERDWKRTDLEALGLYRPGEMNDCYPAMEQALRAQPEVTSWNLYFFRQGELVRLGEQAGLEVVEQLPIQEASGFAELRRTRPSISYDYIEFKKV